MDKCGIESKRLHIIGLIEKVLLSDGTKIWKKFFGIMVLKIFLNQINWIIFDQGLYFLS